MERQSGRADLSRSARARSFFQSIGPLNNAEISSLLAPFRSGSRTIRASGERRDRTFFILQRWDSPDQTTGPDIDASVAPICKSAPYSVELATDRMSSASSSTEKGFARNGVSGDATLAEKTASPSPYPEM